MSPREKPVIRAIVKALMRHDTQDLLAYSSSYGVRQRLNTHAGRALWSADLLQALLDSE